MHTINILQYELRLSCAGLLGVADIFDKPHRKKNKTKKNQGGLCLVTVETRQLVRQQHNFNDVLANPVTWKFFFQDGSND